jgi:hypothetical protein
MTLRVRKSEENLFTGPLTYHLFDTVTQRVIVDGLCDFSEAVQIAHDINAISAISHRRVISIDRTAGKSR